MALTLSRNALACGLGRPGLACESGPHARASGLKITKVIAVGHSTTVQAHARVAELAKRFGF